MSASLVQHSFQQLISFPLLLYQSFSLSYVERNIERVNCFLLAKDTTQSPPTDPLGYWVPHESINLKLPVIVHR